MYDKGMLILGRYVPGTKQARRIHHEAGRQSPLLTRPSLFIHHPFMSAPLLQSNTSERYRKRRRIHRSHR
eukprot:scaffold2040_cov196-Alexandrium_tamarense.AAC.16